MRTQAPVALWVSTSFGTFAVDIGPGGHIERTPPIAKWALHKRFSALHLWAKRQDPRAKFAWIYADGTYGEVWQ